MARAQCGLALGSLFFFFKLNSVVQTHEFYLVRTVGL